VIEGLADEPVDVVIATGKRNLEDDTIISAESLAPLPPNMVAEDFVDGRAMLAQASVHITHGGCNSVHESLLAGVPMLFMPQAYDQAPLGKCVKVLGAGEFAREVPAEVRAHTRLLLENGTAGERARDVSRHLQDFDGSGRVAEVFERVLDGAPLKA
jgi:zeaxanthin glucosyltransferase